MRNSLQIKNLVKTNVINSNGITKFNNLKPDISLEKYNLKKDGYILFVGRIVQEKRIIDLISAFEKIKTTKKLVIVGIYDNNKNYYDELFKFKTKLENRLIFTGKLECHNVKLLYQNAYCFVLPSESEGMPIVLLEAMSFGKCPLVSDIKENLDVIENNGFSFRVKDEKDLQRKLEYMLKHKSEIDKKGKECKKLVEAKYNWDKIAKQTLKVYEDVLGKRK
jgi:glycosyltransferase involved in cell wall biosynthesis